MFAVNFGKMQFQCISWNMCVRGLWSQFHVGPNLRLVGKFWHDALIRNAQGKMIE